MSRLIDQWFEIMLVVDMITLVVAGIVWLIHDAHSHGKNFWLAVLLIVVFFKRRIRLAVWRDSL